MERHVCQFQIVSTEGFTPEVCANLVYRVFTRIGDEKVPDAKTLARLGQAIGPEVIGKLHERLMELARERGLVLGRNKDLPRRRQARLNPFREILETMGERVRQVIRQTKARVFHGVTFH